jgi:peptide/nickel transport system permease protein
MKTRSQRVGLAMLACLAGAALAAPILAPYSPSTQHPDLAYAPPTRAHLVRDGTIRRPFVYPLRISDRLERRFVADTTAPSPVRFFSQGRLFRADSAAWFVLGADPLGRDVLSRILYGARLSLSVALVAAGLTLAIGGLLGALAGFAGGRIDRVVMAVSDFVVLLPAAYVVVTLRAAMPLTLSTPTVFWTMVLVLAAATWPLPARGVRAIVAAERQREYVEAAYAAGASPLRILLRHVLPAARGHLAAQGFLLFPAFILAEATLSFLGLGFAEPSASWGVMLNDAARVAAIAEAPWLLMPAFAIVFAVLATHLVTMGGAVPDRPL